MSLNALPPRPIALTIIACVLLLLCINAWAQVARILLGFDRLESVALLLLQVVSGSAALAASIGTWRRRTWAPAATLGYGVITAALVIAVGPLLSLPADERGGLLFGGAAVLLVTVALAWAIRRNV